jgi:hypothetical protein
MAALNEAWHELSGPAPSWGSAAPAPPDDDDVPDPWRFEPDLALDGPSTRLLRRTIVLTVVFALIVLTALFVYAFVESGQLKDSPNRSGLAPAGWTATGVESVAFGPARQLAMPMRSSP